MTGCVEPHGLHTPESHFLIPFQASVPKPRKETNLHHPDIRGIQRREDDYESLVWLRAGSPCVFWPWSWCAVLAWKEVGPARRCTPAGRVYTRPAWSGSEISLRHVQACLGARPGRSLSIKRPSLASSPGGRATFELTCRRALVSKLRMTGWVASRHSA